MTVPASSEFVLVLAAQYSRKPSSGEGEACLCFLATSQGTRSPSNGGGQFIPGDPVYQSQDSFGWVSYDVGK
jgi:hypothetical protein